jgi:hypothetical protein
LVVLGIELRVFQLVKQVLHPLNSTPVLLLLVCFSDRGSHFCTLGS